MSGNNIDDRPFRSPRRYESPLRTRNLELSLKGYTRVELEVLRDIIAAATDNNDGTSFLAVFKAYDTVLKARSIDPVNDRVYFKFLLKLARVEGATWAEKLESVARGTSLEQQHPQLPITRSTSTQVHHKSLPSRTRSEVDLGSSSAPVVVTRSRSVIESNRPRLDSLTRRTGLSADRDFSITFDDNPRRYTILRQFWHVWRAKAMRRRSRHAFQIENADRHYRSILLPLTFDTWKQKWRYFAILQRRVEGDRRNSILTRCLHWWRYRTRSTITENNQKHNEIALRRMFSAWLGEVRRKQERLNSVTLSHVLELWKAKASTTKDLRITAEHWNRQHVLRQFWKMWFFRTCSVKTVLYYEIKLKQRNLAWWIFKSRRLREMKRYALYLAKKNALALMLRKWRAAMQTSIAQVEKANSYRRHQILSKALSLWHRNQELDLRAALFSAKVDNKLVSLAWEKWRTTTKLTVDACTQAEWKLLRTSFKAWRDDAVATQIEKQIDRRNLKQSFRLWMIQQRGKLLGRVRDEWFLRETLEIWRDRLREIQDALNSTLDIAEKSRALKIIGTSIKLWRETLAIRNEEYEVAVIHDERSIFRKSLTLWRRSLDSHRQAIQAADHARYYFHARRSLMTWHSKLIQRRKRKRQSALDSFQSQKHAKLIKSCFSLWKQRSTEYLVLQNEAEEIRQERESDLVEDIFNHWKEKTQFLRSLQNLAINHYSSQLINGHFQEWRAAFDRLTELTQLSEEYAADRDHLLAMQHIRMWRMRIFQLRGPAMQADLFKQRSQRLKLRLMLRIWKEKSKQKGAADPEVDTSTSSVVSNSDRAHTAPLTPKRSTRRHLWRNLHSR